MEAREKGWSAPLKALALDWLMWAYVPLAIVYFFRDRLHGHPYTVWLYLGGIALGLIVALVLERKGITLGERILGLVPPEPEVEGVVPPRTPWYRTLVGITGLILGVVTLVLGWNITEINLYYVFTRADRMANMTNRLMRPYWEVFPVLIEGMIETIFLALMSTVISVPIAALLSFFAARNLMQHVTAPYGTLVAGFIGAVAGGVLGTTLAGWILSPLDSGAFDVALINGIVKPLLLVVGAAVLGLVFARVMKRLSDGQHPQGARIATIVLTAALGVVLMYVLVSLGTAFIYAGSWALFVRDGGPWPYILLALGGVIGAAIGVRQKATSEFPLGQVVYSIVRFIMNITRSIEPFVWALIFVTWFRLGPFPGMVALMVHSVAALGKLYSEQIEGIDPGPLEAVRATGANELQTIVYAVVPQIIPPFISFTIYRWDINVRMSTIIGLVGGGGIGQMLFQYQNLGQWRSVSVAVILIVAVVMTLDNVSARIRERIV